MIYQCTVFLSIKMPQIGIVPMHLNENYDSFFAHAVLGSINDGWSQAPASGSNCKNHTIFPPIEVAYCAYASIGRDMVRL